jgi:prevent-host-death family protein
MNAIHVGSRELKNRLSQYLRRVKAGETVIVTERGKPVGQIVPIQADAQERLRLLAAAGVLDWDGRQTPPYRPRAVNRSGRLLSDLVAEERE